MKYESEIKLRQIMSKPFWILRVIIKKLLLKFNIRNVSFCKVCGIDVRDFTVPDDDWKRVYKASGNKNILCWNCYCDYDYLSRSNNT